MRPPRPLSQRGVPIFPGPTAAREAAIWREIHPCFDPAKKDVLFRELGDLYASAWREPVPEEDIEWARDRRERVMKTWDAIYRELSGQWARDGYLKSSGGTFDGNPAPPYEMAEAAWRAFGERVRNAAAEEGEMETVEAAVAAYSEYSEQPVPQCSDHWLAAVRAIRAVLATPKG